MSYYKPSRCTNPCNLSTEKQNSTAAVLVGLSTTGGNWVSTAKVSGKRTEGKQTILMYTSMP